jgi:excinuclease ABC subunit A
LQRRRNHRFVISATTACKSAPSFRRHHSEPRTALRETDSRIVREELSKYISQKDCTACAGQRLNREARHVFVAETNLPTITAWPIEKCLQFFNKLELEGRRGEIAKKIVKEVHERLQFLVNVGLDYLTLDRKADSLSGGEAQRIRLASQIGAGLVGVMYILDEPSSACTSATTRACWPR